MVTLAREGVPLLEPLVVVPDEDRVVGLRRDAGGEAARLRESRVVGARPEGVVEPGELVDDDRGRLGVAV